MNQSLESVQDTEAPPKEQEDALAELEKLRRRDERIRSLERVRNEANYEVESCKLSLKEAKEHAKACEKNLQRAIRGDDQQKEFPFKEVETQASQEEDQSWREVTIEDAGIPEKLCAFLLENKPPLETLGDLADWSDKHKKSLTDVTGIGPAKATQIEDALVEFWAQRNSTPEDEGEEDAEGDAGEDEDDEE